MRAPDFWYRKGGGAAALATLLSPLGLFYEMAARAKSAMQSPFVPRAKVICVGNLTLGGTGKTPIALAIAERLKLEGLRVVFLSRGYGGKLAGPLAVEPDVHSARDVGDEPLLLAQCATTIISRDRAAGARMADELGADVVVMDDGHQNQTVRKDLSLVVVDAQTGFGNERLFPAGPLRESVARGLARADAVIAVGDDALYLGTFGGPVLRAKFVPRTSDAFRDAPLVAFAGIGRPEKFFATLSEIGARVLARHGFADHHDYNEAELARLKDDAARRGALLVTTEKDFVRIPGEARDGIVPLKIGALFADEGLLTALLDKIAPFPANSTP